MKQSNIKADTNIFETLNPSFHSFLKSYATSHFMENPQNQTVTFSIKQKEENSINSNKISKDEDNSNPSDFVLSENLYYDIQSINDNFTSILMILA